MNKRTTPISIAVIALVLASAATAGSASAAGGTSYVGVTSQAAHVSLKVNPSLTRVRVLYVDWSAGALRCTNRQEYFSSTMLGMWGSRPPGIRAGRFTSRIVEEFPGDRGGIIVERFSLTGRVNRSRASGRFEVQVTERDAAGRIVNRCTTGRITWNAVD